MLCSSWRDAFSRQHHMLTTWLAVWWWPCAQQYRCMPVVLSQIKYETFLEDVNNILTSGEVPNLFPKDELTAVLDELRPAAKAAGVGETQEQLAAFFFDRVRWACVVQQLLVETRQDILVGMASFRQHGVGCQHPAAAIDAAVRPSTVYLTMWAPQAGSS